jgi:hypothetical protein
MVMKAGDDGWEPLSPSDVHQMDQYLAKFSDIARRLAALTIRTMPDDGIEPDAVQAQEHYEEFAAIVMELEGIEIVSFVSFLVAAQIRAQMAMEKMSLNMSRIMDTVIDCIGDPASKAKFLAARAASREDIVARDLLFEDGTVSFSLEGMSADQLKPAESYTTGTGKKIVAVHRADSCMGACVLHRPISGPWDAWPTDWDNENRMMLRICPCGTPHPVIEDILRGHDGTHHCCGCPCGQNAINERIDAAFAKMKESIEAGDNPPTITLEFGEGETYGSQ